MTHRRGLSEQFHKGNVHLDRIDHTRRQKLGFDLMKRITQGHPDVQKFRGRRIPLEIINVALFDVSGIPAFEVFRLDQFLHIVRRISHGIERTDNGSHGGTRNIVNRNIVFFQGTDDPDMSQSFRSSATQHKPYFLGLRRKQVQQGYQKQADDEI